MYNVSGFLKINWVESPPNITVTKKIVTLKHFRLYDTNIFSHRPFFEK